MDWRGFFHSPKLVRFVYNRYMFYVYILKNKKRNIYVGFSSDLKARIKQHNSGSSKFTREFRPWELVYYEAFKSKHDARKRERNLKEYGSSLGQLKKRISDSIFV